MPINAMRPGKKSDVLKAASAEMQTPQRVDASPPPTPPDEEEVLSAPVDDDLPLSPGGGEPSDDEVHLAPTPPLDDLDDVTPPAPELSVPQEEIITPTSSNTGHVSGNTNPPTPSGEPLEEGGGDNRVRVLAAIHSIGVEEERLAAQTSPPPVSQKVRITLGRGMWALLATIALILLVLYRVAHNDANTLVEPAVLQIIAAKNSPASTPTAVRPVAPKAPTLVRLKELETTGWDHKLTHQFSDEDVAAGSPQTPLSQRKMWGVTYPTTGEYNLCFRISENGGQTWTPYDFDIGDFRLALLNKDGTPREVSSLYNQGITVLRPLKAIKLAYYWMQGDRRPEKDVCAPDYRRF